jgi:fermentation-respiration switch protein FrsA (DUF1100 family)
MVVCGDRDPFVPVEHAAGLARQLPDGRLFVVPDCGHEVMVRRPGLFNEAVAGFFRSTETVARRRADSFDDTLRHPDAPAEAGSMAPTDASWLEGETR